MSDTKTAPKPTAVPKSVLDVKKAPKPKKEFVVPEHLTTRPFAGLKAMLNNQ